MQQIFITIVIVSILFLIVLLMLSQMNIQMWDYYDKSCSELNGSLITYECYRSPLNDGYCDLESTKSGQYCVLKNGTEVDLTIRNAIA